MKRYAVSAALVLGSLVVALLAGEGMLRASGFSYANFWLPDDLTGSRLRPGIEGWNRHEGETYVKINSRGLRDREHALEKPRGVYRIAVLGDSYAEALQVDLEETFWSLLPARLAACGFRPGQRTETINFGVSGYGTAQQLLTLRHRAWDYAPDLVLVAFFPGNDVRNNSKSLEPEKLRPFFVLRDGALALDDSFRGDARYQQARRFAEQRAWLQDLRLYQLARRVRAGELRLGDNAPIARAIAAGGKSLPLLAEPGLDENVFREPVDAVWREAWTITEKLLLAMHEETRARGAAFVVAVLSSPGAVYPDAAMRKRYAEILGKEELFYAERRIERLGGQHGFE
ncbi:MAG: SGNH/GDSL hydrolase family protein, partial [Betaproteobacteria bacterium]